jgi:hypothetical protein
VIGQGDDHAGRVALVWFAAFTASTTTSVVMALGGSWSAASGYATASIAYLGAIMCAERWRTWERIATGRPD